jgi:putative intracellular protease/amidase
MDTPRILIVVTNVAEFTKVGYRTGLWLGELTHFWDTAEAAGIAMEIASPAGGRVPLDPEGLLLTEIGAAVGLKGNVHKRYRDRAFMDRLRDTLPLQEADPDRYAAIYLTGGHGVMTDFRGDPVASQVVAFYKAGRIVSAVCHGPCGLLDACLDDGQPLVSGSQVTGFSWKEEVVAKRDDAVDYNLEDELRKRGARYTSALVPFAPHVVEDGQLITGQNPASAHGVAEAVVKRLLASRPA